jgi:hypothetical protein
MERTKSDTTPANDGKVWWRKVGGGSLRLSNRIIKPGEKFRAFPDEIPTAFRDVVLPLEDIPETGDAKPVNVVKTEYKLQPRGDSKLWYDVVDKNGKVLNEKGMKKETAEKLIQDLEK